MSSPTVVTVVAVVGTVLAAVTTFFAHTLVTAPQESDGRIAVQLAADALEGMREVPGNQVRSWIAARTSPQTVTVAGHPYTRTWEPPRDARAGLVRAVVRVTWASTACSAGTCAYSAATLVSTADTEPVFRAPPA